MTVKVIQPQTNIRESLDSLQTFRANSSTNLGQSFTLGEGRYAEAYFDSESIAAGEEVYVMVWCQEDIYVYNPVFIELEFAACALGGYFWTAFFKGTTYMNPQLSYGNISIAQDESYLGNSTYTARLPTAFYYNYGDANKRNVFGYRIGAAVTNTFLVSGIHVRCGISGGPSAYGGIYNKINKITVSRSAP